MNKQEIQEEIDLMEGYSKMMLKRKDRHGLWDAAIDLQRLDDRLSYVCTHHCNCDELGGKACCNCGHSK